VQSTAIYLLACDGRLNFDVAIFADTGWEPAEVYAHLSRLEQLGGPPIVRVSAGNIRADALDPEHRFASMPLFVRNPDGSEGMARRQCTSEYKLKPIKAEVRRRLSYPHPTPVPRGVFAEVAIGISVDEIGRARDSDVQYMRNVFPLLDLGWSRKNCERYLRSAGWESVSKSACIGCPFHGNAQWRNLRDTCECGHHRDSHRMGRLGCEIDSPRRCECLKFHAPEWDDAVDFDHQIRNGSARANAVGKDLRGSMFLHRSRVPLDEAPIDRVTRAEWSDRQGDLFDQAEDGDPDGCSPWACRSGQAVTA
jgi:hypothetical protein